VAWVAVTIRRRGSVRLPGSCAYCNGPAERRLPLHVSRRLGVRTGRLTRTIEEEHLEIAVPFCATHGQRTERLRRELRRIRRAGGLFGALLGLVVVLVLFDLPFGTRLPLAIIIAALLGGLAFVAAALLARTLPRYRDYGAGVLGVDLIAGHDVLTFRFTNPTYAATFRTYNGMPV